MFLDRAVSEYFRNIVTVLVFLLLGLFVLAFSQFGNTFLGTGTVFLEYNIFGAPLEQAAAQIILALVYLAFFSVFLAVMIFAVRRNVTQLKFDHYLTEKIPKFALELFEFWIVFSIVLFGIGLVLTSLHAPFALTALILLVLSALAVFVPQSVVVDEVSWNKALSHALHFFFHNLGLALAVLVIGFVMIGILPFVELFFDQFAFSGRFVSLVLLLLIVLPFFEVLKTVAYLNKFELAKRAF